MNKPTHDGKEMSESERTAQCASLIDGNNGNININSPTDDASNEKHTNFTTRDDTEMEEQDGEALSLSRQKELNPSLVVLRGGISDEHSQFCSRLRFATRFLDPKLHEHPLESIKASIMQLETIPYMSDCLREDLAKAKLIQDSESSDAVNEQTSLPVVNLSLRQKELLNSLQDENQRKKFEKEFLLLAEERQLHAKKAQMHAKKAQMHALLFSIRNTLRDVERQTDEVYFQLMHFAGMSQAERSMTSTMGSSSNKKQKMDESIGSMANKRSELFVVAEPARVVLSVLSNCSDIEIVLPGLCQVASPGTKAQAPGVRLQKVARIIDNYLEEATFLPPTENDNKDKLTAAMKSLRSKIRMAMNGSDDGLCTKETSPEQQRRNTAKSAAKYAPGPRAGEVAGAQQWIELLFQSVGACWEPPSSAAASPSKISLQKEASIPNTHFRLMRSVDFLLRKEGRWEAVIFDDMLTIPIEVKPGYRTGKNTLKLLEQAAEQVCSHFAKHVFIGFNFARYGIPCHITGVVVCMGAIQILQLRYEKVGTPEAKLALYKSAYLPLMTASNFQKWASSSGNKKDELKELRAALYGPNEQCGVDDVGVPKGIRALFNLMDKPSKDLYGLSFDVQESNQQVLGKPLGSGATSIVFENKKRCSVVKLSRYGAKQGIENERRILKHLSKECNNNLPQLMDSNINEVGKLQIKLGLVKTELPAIELGPIGEKASAYFMKLSNAKEGSLELILNGVTSALEHMHHQKICHCDVTPKNIIIAQNPGPRAVLIDFSISMAFDASHCGFLGTPEYVHREIFLRYLDGKKSWKPRPDFDKAGLGFSLAFFANRCVRPWDACNPRNAGKATEADLDLLNEAMDERLEAARDAIRAIGDKDLETRILKLLASEGWSQEGNY